MAESIIEMKNVSCISGSRYLVNNVNWEVNKGDQWVVFGRNGCGKTTLLSIIAGYRRYDQGSLKIFNTEYTKENILQLRSKIGWISSSFFDTYYHTEMVKDIVLSGLTGTLGKPVHVDDREEKKAKELIKILGIEKKWLMPFNMLSKGERQHVLIARAFMVSPEILILDEPGTGLDVLAREQLLEMVQNLSEKHNTTVIYVTHYVEEILPIFNKCLLMKNGMIYKKGDTDKLITSECLSSFFEYPVEIKECNGAKNLLIDFDPRRVNALIGKAGYYEKA